MLVKTFGCAIFGISATIITVEVNIGKGIKFFLVGLPDNAVKESHHRIKAALANNGYKIPGKGIVINMAPADIKKEGSSYDLTIAVGILAASGQITSEVLGDFVIMGELSLDGGIRPIRGALPIALEAKSRGFKGVILPKSNSREAAIVEGLQVYGVENILEVITFLEENKGLEEVKVDVKNDFFNTNRKNDLDFSDVKGQENIKRAFEIAAAGGHNVLLVGPPGAGKTMLAKRLPTILPPFSIEEALETTKIYSVAGKLVQDDALVSSRPFRNPHHTISDVALVGGGGYPQPGEISLAHNGVLFLDEFPEFKRSVLEVLRQPLEERMITISRAKFAIDYPASFMLIAAMNPCPCGFYNHPEKDCVCPPGMVQKYLNKISGPLLDRFDIHIEVTPVSFDELTSFDASEKSADIRERVINARVTQDNRYAKKQDVYCNAQLAHQDLEVNCPIDEMGRSLLKLAMQKLDLSARAYDRIIKVARTIADLEDCQGIEPTHLAEAIQYRNLDRANWSGGN